VGEHNAAEDYEEGEDSVQGGEHAHSHPVAKVCEGEDQVHVEFRKLPV